MRKSNLLPLALCLLLGACGFHLRGSQQGELPFERLDVQARDSYGETARLLRERLQSQGVQVGAGAPYRLQLREKLTTRSVSYTGSARTAERELNTRLDFRLSDSSNRLLLEDSVEQARLYTHDSSNMVASDREYQELLEESRSDSVQQLLTRLQALTPESLAALETEAKARAEAEQQALERARREREAMPQRSPLQFPQGQ